LLRAQEPIENDLKDRLGTLFQLDYDLLLYDLTSVSAHKTCNEFGA
jgi:hypothetical protein